MNASATASIPASIVKPEFRTYAPRPMNRMGWWLLALVMVLGAGLRLRGLGNQSLWYDETLTLESARAPLPRVAESVEHLENMPPTYFYLMHFWVRCFGDSETSLRMPSALAGIGAVGMVFLLARRLFGRGHTAIVAALLTAVSRFQITYAQEARAYALVFLLAVVSCYCLAVLVTEPGRRTAQVGYVAAGAGMLWLHPFSVFVLGAQGVWFLGSWVGRRRHGHEYMPMPHAVFALTLRRFVTLLGAVVLLFGPYIPTMLTIAGRGQPWMWKMRPTVWETLRLYADTTPLLVLGLVLMVVGAVMAVRRGMGWSAGFCVLVFLVPVVAPVILSKGKHPIFTPRYSIGALAVFYPLVAYGITAMTRPLAIAAGVAMLALTWPNLAEDVRLGANGQRKDDARAVAADIAELGHSGDVVWCPDFRVNRVMGFYLQSQPAVRLVEELPENEPLAEFWVIQVGQTPADPALGDGYEIEAVRSHQGVKLLKVRRAGSGRN